MKMKKLALLVGANPKTSNGGPRVKLHEGEWKLVEEGVVDSKIYYTFFNAIENYFPADFVIGPCEIQMTFHTRGTESHISVYAELQEAISGN